MTSLSAQVGALRWRQEDHLSALAERTGAFESNGSEIRVDALRTHKRQSDKAAISSSQPKRDKDKDERELESGCSQSMCPSSSDGKARSLALRKEFIA